MTFLGNHKLALILTAIFISIAGLSIHGGDTDTTAKTENSNNFTSVNQQSPMARKNTDAQVSIIQYSDFLCPSCSFFSTQIMPFISDEYIDTGKAQFEFRPMAFIAEGSWQAGMGAYCAIEQDAFWPYHDAIYSYVGQRVFNDGLDPTKDLILNAQLVKAVAQQAGLEEAGFSECLDSRRYFSDIQNATQTANANGIQSTPYILINGQEYKGNLTLESVQALIKAKL